MVLCEMAFNKPLPDLAVSSLAKKFMPPKKALKKKASWWLWRSSNQEEGGSSHDQSQPSQAIAVVTSDNEATSSRLVKSFSFLIITFSAL